MIDVGRPAIHLLKNTRRRYQLNLASWSHCICGSTLDANSLARQERIEYCTNKLETPVA